MACRSRSSVLNSVSDHKSKRDAQKYFLESILVYGDIDLNSLSELLEISPLLLCQVMIGQSYLGDEQSVRLVHFFLMLFTESSVDFQ